MMDFIYELYKSDNFVMILSIVLVVLVLLFVLVFIFGKKDQKLEETKRLQKLEMDTFKEEKKNEEKVEVPVVENVSVPSVAPTFQVTEPTPVEEVKPISNEEANMVVFEPKMEEVNTTLDEEIKDIPVMPKPLFSDHEEEESPISINELPVLNEEDKKMESGLSTLESIKNEFDKIEIPEVKENPVIKEEKEEKIFKPSPQIFSSVYVNNNKEESVTKVEDTIMDSKKDDKEVIPEVKEDEVSSKLFTIEDDDDDDFELPTLKDDDKPILSDNLGETYELK